MLLTNVVKFHIWMAKFFGKCNNVASHNVTYGGGNFLHRLYQSLEIVRSITHKVIKSGRILQSI